MILKASKLKKRQRQRKIRVRIRPFLDGYGLGTRIRTTLVRTLIPGPATDPHLRICSPVLALKARMAGLILHFLNGLFDMNFYLEKGVPPLAWRWGGTAIDEKSGLNQGIVVSKALFFTLFSSFDTSRGGGRRIGGPNTPAGALGSPVKSSPNLLAKNQTLILVPVLRLLLHELYGPTYILTIF